MTERALRSARRRAALLVMPILGACGGVSLDEEAEIGAAYAAELQRELPMIRDSAAIAGLNRLGGRLAALADSAGRVYTFHLVDSPEVNAFALPGGHIFVNRGMIEMADDAAELAGVLGHEIAHVSERHGIDQLRKRQGAGALVSIVYTLLGRDPGVVERIAIEAGGAAVFARYGREAEREADRRAIHTLAAAGYDPDGVASFFEALLERQAREPSVLEGWFATHPATRERVDDARAMSRTIGVDRNGLVDDAAEYRAFRARMLDIGSPRAQDGQRR